MNKITRICTLLVALLLVFSMLTVSALADDPAPSTCVGTERNVASEATITTDTDCWTHLWFLDWLIDGDKTTGAGSTHRQGSITTTLTFDESYTFTRLVFTVMSEGRVANDRNLSQVSGQYQNFNFTVKLYSKSAGGDVEEFSQEYSTDGRTEVVVEPNVNAKIYKMSVYWWCGWNNGLTFWEWETFTADGHDWKAPTTPTIAPTCTTVGLGTYTCESCGETKDSVIPATGHSNSNPCATTCSVCTTAITPAHKYATDCDTKCELCSAGNRTAPHVVATDDFPCKEGICGVPGCGATRPVAADHTFANHCTTICSVCGDDKLREEIHTWSYDGNTDPCETTCGWDWCDEPKPHKYDEVNLCAELCLACNGAPRVTETPHTYGPKDEDTTPATCDKTCNVCNEVRLAPHNFEYACDPICNTCTESRIVVDLHTYTNDCDADCNEEKCNWTRKGVGHEYLSDCSTECKKCAEPRTPIVVGHRYTSVCDNICDVEFCGYVRTVELDPNYDPDHAYSSDCDEICDNVGCGFKRTPVVVGHKYTNGCDTVCDIPSCGFERVAPIPNHTYSYDCDDTCDECQTKGREATHAFPLTWIMIVEPERKTEGKEIRNCLYCNLEEVRTVPALGGISGGAIAGIVIGSVAVLGLGGFSIFWFVIKKKSFADLIAVFKK